MLTSDFMQILKKINQDLPLSSLDLFRLLSSTTPEEHQNVIACGEKIKKQNIGKIVSIRGLIEISNFCQKDCFYCGIRKSNTHVTRYKLSQQEILDSAKWALEQRFGSIVLQGGEIYSPAFSDFIEDTLHKIRKFDHGKLGITLSLGEQDEETYQRWFNAGAHRYLLRIESSNPNLYHQLHPADHSWEHRKGCLESLRRCGYQVGTGVMSGIPGQTIEDLVNDILFFKQLDIDMIGMGPYVPHHDTPLGTNISLTEEYKKHQLELGLRMIAVTRIFLKDVNIASATALQALQENGRELGLEAGANVIMPNMTAKMYRQSYKLYDNKPGVFSDSGETWKNIEASLTAIGETIAYNQWGDSKHFYKRQSHENL